MSSPRKGMRTCTKCGRNRAERFFKPNGRICSFCRRRRVSTASRETRIFETYGITLAEYDEINAAQWFKCAICERSPKYNKDVDHDHQLERTLIETGVAPNLARRMSVRGLLCKLCNRRLLPSVRDDADVLHRAVGYLDKPPAFAVLGALSTDGISSTRRGY